MHAERQRATRHCGSDVTAAITGLSALRLPQLLQSVPNHFPRLLIAPNRKNKACICLYVWLCSIFSGGKEFGAWELEIGCCALGIGHWPWALGIGLWGEGCGDWSSGVRHWALGSGHCRLAHGRHQAKAIKATYREVSDEPVWRQTYKSPIIFSYVQSS